MNKPSKAPATVALEDLLRLKRAERPDADFWQEFERGLRQKQMAAIMEPKPWWLGWSLLWRRPGVRLTTATAMACAAVAATLALRVPAPAGGELAANPAGAEPAVRVALGDGSAATARVEAGDDLVLRNQDLDTSQGGASALAVAQVNAPVLADEAGAALGMRAEAAAETELPARADGALAAAFAQVAMIEEGAPETMAAATDGGADAGDLLRMDAALAAAPLDAPTAGFSSGELLAEARPEAIFTETTEAIVTDPRYQRLLAGVDESAATGLGSSHSLAAVRDHVLHHVMNNDELYASISRLGVRGDRLLLRF